MEVLERANNMVARLQQRRKVRVCRTLGTRPGVSLEGARVAD
jgi:hypothetical protein